MSYELYKEMQNILNEGQVGDFSLIKFTIDERNCGFRNTIPFGDYIRLMYKNFDCVMSNTPMEARTNYDFISKANGDVFIAGLGIGMILLAIQDKEEVKSITVLEKYPEVIELVGNQLPLNDKVKIIQGDVFDYEFPRGTKFDTLYFDIWSYINSDVYEEMKELKKKYKRCKKTKKENENAFMSCWAEWEAKNNRRLV